MRWGYPMKACRGGVQQLWGKIRHRLIMGRGMFSDDTEHTMMLATALIENQDDAVAFLQAFGWKLRW